MGIVKSDLLKQFRDNYPSFQKKDLNKIVDIFFKEIVQTLKKGDSVEIRSFGRFSIRNYKSRMGRNPKTGEKINVPSKKSIHFKMSKEMFKNLNEKK